jgi:transposase
MATGPNKILENSDIPKILGVSKQTPANWIKQTLHRKIDLT